MKKYSQGGFTLIELLVVIAIIGILSSVVLASLSTARNKGADARVQSQLQAMRAQAELYSNASAAAFTRATCPSSSSAGTIFESANNGLFGLLSGLTLTNSFCVSTAGIPSTGAVWAVAVNTSTGAWCVDSTGASRNSASGGSAYANAAAAIPISTTACQ